MLKILLVFLMAGAAFLIVGHAAIDHGPRFTSSSVTNMSWVPAGEFWMGCIDDGMPDCRPLHRVFVDGFWMDRTHVTNDDFLRFVAATGYVTVAERPPPQYPGTAVQDLVPGSLVFHSTSDPVPLDDSSQWWAYVPKADWRHPRGPGSDLKGLGRHPVVQVAWSDANAYCHWEGKRLPTEAEFERAARGGLDRKRYAWGNELEPGGHPMANIWRGSFPDRPDAGSGHTTPVASYPANGYGLYDMAGNAWQWISDWYRADYYSTLPTGAITRNPGGPGDSYDPDEPGVKKRVQRGGSFLCSSQFCSRFLVGARGRAEPDSSASHTGFRCAFSPTGSGP